MNERETKDVSNQLQRYSGLRIEVLDVGTRKISRAQQQSC